MPTLQQKLWVLGTANSGVPSPAATSGSSGGGSSPSPGRYIHTQSGASAVWTVTHSMGTFPSVVTVSDDEPGRPVIADVFYVDNNTLTITWASASTGKAYLSSGEAADPFVHTQSSATSEWTVAHGLGTFPQVVTVTDSDPGHPSLADVFYVDNNTLTITWASPETGKAYLS